VHLDADRLGALVFELFRGRVGAVEIEIGDRDRGAILRVDLRDALADAAGRSGDEGHFAVESHGYFSLDFGAPRRAAGEKIRRPRSGNGAKLGVIRVMKYPSLRPVYDREVPHCSIYDGGPRNQPSRAAPRGSTPRSLSLRYRCVRSMPTALAS